MKPEVRKLRDHDPRMEAWLLSRPHAKEGEVRTEDLDRFDASINDLRVLTFQVTSSVYLRELLASVAGYGMWAQTSRISSIEERVLDPMAEYHFGKEVREHFELQKERALSRQGEHLDKVRLLIPASQLTSYTYQLPFRSLVALLKWMKAREGYLADYARLFEQALGIRVEDYPYAPYRFERPDGSLQTRLLPPFRVVSARLPLALRAQLVRHTGLKVVDEVPYLDLGSLFLSDMEYPVLVQYVTSEAYHRGILSSRSCWIAHYEIWEPIFPQDLQYQDFLELLPCKGKKTSCKFSLDMEARIRGEDPGLVCPLWDPDPKWIELREEQVGRSRITTFYREYLYAEEA